MLFNPGCTKIYEKITRQTPTLIPTDNQIRKPLRYSERHTPSTHVEEVEKSIGEQGRTQSLVETFTGQAARWWETHSPQLQTWTTVSTYFVERFERQETIQRCRYSHIQNRLRSNRTYSTL
jgi:hypothetical protein